jgi:2-keto-3-deoxy-L-rhamnonate aldolase RhmA
MLAARKKGHNTREKEKATQAVKNTPHIYQGKRATMVLGTAKYHHKEKERNIDMQGENCCFIANIEQSLLISVKAYVLAVLFRLHREMQ